jgi:hypothetical protein
MKKPKKDCNIERIEQIFAAGQGFAIDLYNKGYLEENLIQHCLNSMGSICLAIMEDFTKEKVIRKMTRKNRSKRAAK